ncbi:hypothetical protein FRC03_002193 [Tulasnella sp. 419]|nr:hypothetical protein FRC02_004062 [Tulasnella sp. 418]KAG8964119.1 hypothetical protein FRC03_002193 [Tulasnella sp. 419]
MTTFRAKQMIEAARVLSNLLTNAGIPHAFYGSFTTIALGAQRETEEIFCIVEGGFRNVRLAIKGSEIMTTAHSSWSARLFATYHEPIPSIEIEILNCGETGPRKLDTSNIMLIHGVPFLSISEFLRAKMNAWLTRGSEGDALDIIYVLARYWQNVDLNRIQEREMDKFIRLRGVEAMEASQAWKAVKARYCT